jgi:hypothetical protein
MKMMPALLLFCFLLSCGSSIPKEIIPPEKMETILWQLMQVDEFTANAFTRDSTHNLTTERILRYRQVFRLNQTNKEAFSKSYTWYMAHPDITKTMFDSIGVQALRQRDTANIPRPLLKGANNIGQGAGKPPALPLHPMHQLPAPPVHK